MSFAISQKMSNFCLSLNQITDWKLPISNKTSLLKQTNCIKCVFDFICLTLSL